MSDEDDPRRHAARIEQLLGDVRAGVGPVAWQRIDELVSRLIALHGAALGRALRLVEEAGALDASLKTRLCDDELVGAMLALHGMHPVAPIERARIAAERVRAHLGEGAGTIEMQLDGDGILVIAFAGEWRAALSRVADAVRHAVEEAAPDIGAVVFRGVAAESSPAALVQLDVARSRAAAR